MKRVEPASVRIWRTPSGRPEPLSSPAPSGSSVTLGRDVGDRPVPEARLRRRVGVVDRDGVALGALGGAAPRQLRGDVLAAGDAEEAGHLRGRRAPALGQRGAGDGEARDLGQAREGIVGAHSRDASSQIEHDGVVRARAADQRAAGGRWLDRVGVVVEAAGDERRLAAVADAGAARPADGHVAGLGELEQVRVVLAPRDREAAARELDRRPASGLTGRRVRVPRGLRGDAGRRAGRRPERLGVDVGGLEPDRDEARR